MNGFNNLSPTELSTLLDDISVSLVANEYQDFEKIIKYLIYTVNYKIQHQQLTHLQRVYDTIQRLISHKRVLIDLELDQAFLNAIHSKYTGSNRLADYLIINLLYQLSVSETIIKRFVISLVDIAVSSFDLHVRRRTVTHLESVCRHLIEECLAGDYSDQKLVVCINLMCILHDHEIAHKLTMNQLEFQVLFKRGWHLVSSFDIDSLQSMMILNWIDIIILDNSSDFLNINIVIDWIISCLYTTSPVLIHSICKSLLKLLNLAINLDLIDNLINLLNIDYYLTQVKHATIIQTLTVFTLVKNHVKSLPTYLNTELNYLVMEIQDSINDVDDSLRFFQYDGADNDMWLDKAVNGCKTGDPSVIHTILSAAIHFPCQIGGACTCTCHENDNCSIKNSYLLISSTRLYIDDDAVAKQLYNKIILYLLSHKAIEDPLVNVNFLLAIYSLLAHYRVKDHNLLDYLLKLLSSPSREVRLATCRIIPLYLIDEKDHQTEVTFSKIFSHVGSIDFKNQLHLGELTIKTLAEMAVVSNGDWLNVLILKLIDILGEQNEHHVNLVYSSLLTIADTKGITPYKLLFPFLPIIAVRLLKTAHILEIIVNILGINKNYFLYRTKDYTVPYVLDYYQYDYIQDILVSCNKSRLELIEDCLPRIIATFLVKNDSIDERYITIILKNAQFRKFTKLDDLLDNIGDIMWNILLQINHDINGKVKNQVNIFNALEFVAKKSISLNANIPRKQLRGYTQLNYIKYLLDEHILEIIQKISECVNHVTTPYYEKVLSVKAIEFLITYDIEASSSVLGQMSSCLQSLIEIKDFEYIAINCVNLLVNKLNTASLISLFDIVISVIFQKFETLELRSQNTAVDIIKRLFKEIKQLDNNYVLYYFSIPYLPPLINYKLDSNFKTIKIGTKVSYFPEFARRLKTLNPYVVKQALRDLINFATTYQGSIQQEFSKDSLTNETINAISTLINTLLDTANRFKYTKHDEILTNSSKALSIVGALDGNKFKLKNIKTHITLIHNFQDYQETSLILTDFLENILIIGFWGSNDPVKQMYYSYAFQQFLKVLRLDDNVIKQQNESLYVDVWNNFSDVTKSTLMPFLRSKFFAKTPNYVGVTYPIYKEGKSFDSWVFELTADLIKRPVQSNVKLLFDAFGALVKYRDNEICNYLLKYLTLYRLLNNSDDTTFVDILTEFKTILETDINALVSADSIESLKLCNLTIFEILDYFNQWHSSTTEYLIYRDETINKSTKSLMKKNLMIIQLFLGQIPLQLIAAKSLECNDYERTIFSFEQRFREHGTVDWLTLNSIYADINDLDSLDGVLKQFPTVNADPLTQLASLQYDSNWSIAQEAFQVLSDFDDNKEYKAKLLEFLNDHASYDQVLNNLATEISTNGNKIPLTWAMEGLEASMVSGFNELDKWLFITKSIGAPQDVFDIITLNIAEGIRNEIVNKDEQLDNVFEELYKTIGSSLTSSLSLSSRNSKLMLLLHSIYDLTKLYHDYKTEQASSNIINSRIENIDQSFESRWKLLSTHNVFHIQFQRIQDMSETFLYCSRLARQDGKYDISVSSILKALALGSRTAEYEYAKLLWAQNQQTDAIKTLKVFLETLDDSETKSKGQLMYSEWLDESNHSSSTAIVEEYTKACNLANDWDKPYYSLGKYYDKLRASNESNDGKYEELTIQSYLTSLNLGSSYIYEVLPKLITIWLDFASKVDQTKSHNSKLNKIIKVIDDELKVIPAYVWYTSFTQILSRITHSNELSYKLLSKISIKVLIMYPRHGLWFILSHLNSKDKLRRTRIEAILVRFTTYKNNSGISTNQLLNGAQELFSNLIEITKVSLKKGTRKASLTDDLKLPKLMEPYDALVIPVRSNLEIRIPSHIHLKRETQAFPKSALVTFNGVDDRVNVFHSLQKPKQITIRGSDGKPYRVMVKNDDTRKDAKVVEFTTMVNRLLALGNESRKRSLVIPNYSVVPLAENMGVIEFVSDVTTMKSIINDERRRSGKANEYQKLFTKLTAAQKVYNTKKENGFPDSKKDLVKVFDSILVENPPVLYKWFIHQFSDPMSWYLGRTSYIRTAAVMSMVGFIIGLGDRHCENILFFKKTGSMLHIDFDCLFDKGVFLPTPEIVPFRLTPNLVDAMGMNKVEGTFRRCCEVSLTILRENEMSLMNILETLLYDPLLDWTDQVDPQDHLKKVRRKIRGLLEENEGVAMNIHGQVDLLIHQSSDHENLCQMYGGWSPFL